MGIDVSVLCGCVGIDVSVLCVVCGHALFCGVCGLMVIFWGPWGGGGGGGRAKKYFNAKAILSVTCHSSLVKVFVWD